MCLVSQLPTLYFRRDLPSPEWSALQDFVLVHLQHVLPYVFCAFLPPGQGAGHPDPGAVSSKGWLVAYVHGYVFEVRLGHSQRHRWEDERPSGGN